MKMRKGSGEFGCLIVIVVGLLVVGPCLFLPSRMCDLKEKEIEIQKEHANDDLRIRILEEEVRQLKALIPSNVVINVDIDKLIRKKTK